MSLCSTAHAEVRYAVRYPASLGGRFSGISDINEQGDAVGFSSLPGSNIQHATLYRAGATTDLGVPFRTDSAANSINSSGQIVMESYGFGPAGPNDFEVHSYLVSDGTVASVEPPGATYARPVSINDSGQIAGMMFLPGPPKTFLYDNGQINFIDLSALGEVLENRPTRINNQGQIAGQYNGNSGFIYSNGTVTDLGPNAVPLSINDRGMAAGLASERGAFIYRDGELTIIGGGGANDINNWGDVVGYGDRGGFIYSGYVRRDLIDLIPQDPRIRYLSAIAINDAGQIAGQMGFSDGSAQAFILDPLFEVPEPTALPAVLLGVALLRRRRAA